MSNIGSKTDFSAFDVIIVDEGTEIEVEHPTTGQPETVIITDDEAIYRGREMFVTQTMYDRIKPA